MSNDKSSYLVKPVLQKAIHNNLYKKITKQDPIKFKNTNHITINFVDDSTSIISFNEHNQIKNYLETYFNLLSCFYNSNNLKINSDKTKLLLIHPPKLNPTLCNFSFKANNYFIQRTKKLKILGTFLSDTLSLEYKINQIVSQITHKIFECSKVKAYTNFKTRLQMMNALVISRISYMLPTYSNCNQCQINKLHKLIMKAARFTIGNYCFKKTTSFILNKCKFIPIKKMISNSSLKIIQKTVNTSQPKPIHNIFKVGTRSTAPVSNKQVPKSKHLSQFYPYKFLPAYNSIPNNLKLVPYKKI